MDVSSLIDQLRENLIAIEQRMASPDFYSDRQTAEKTAREHIRLTNLITTDQLYRKKKQELADNQVLILNETDDEMKEMIGNDIAQLEVEIKHLETQVYNLILPPGENDSRNTIVEIRPAAGGDEASLFASELFRMYTRLSERKKWRMEVLDLSSTEVGGFKGVVFSLEGDAVFKMMKLESGVHRVQRVPVTEASGRIHTSTVTVAVLPEAKDVDIKINPEDLHFDVFRSSGPGGQSVNTTDSAVRVTHIPSGLSVASQQEKSQHRNKEIALRILRARLLEEKQREEREKFDANRKNQVGTGERSERIRTYNYPQNRVTDHRFSVSHFNLPGVMEGEIEDFILEITAIDSAHRLEKEISLMNTR